LLRRCGSAPQRAAGGLFGTLQSADAAERRAPARFRWLLELVISMLRRSGSPSPSLALDLRCSTDCAARRDGGLDGLDRAWVRRRALARVRTRAEEAMRCRRRSGQAEATEQFALRRWKARQGLEHRNYANAPNRSRWSCLCKSTQAHGRVRRAGPQESTVREPECLAHVWIGASTELIHCRLARVTGDQFLLVFSHIGCDLARARDRSHKRCSLRWILRSGDTHALSLPYRP
jgi:hypothetical protein